MAIKMIIGNAKGGVGKTLITSLVGYHLAEKGYKVLMIDVDPQGSLTQIMEKTYGEIKGKYMTLFEGLKEKKLRQAVIKGNENLSYIPAETDLTRISEEQFYKKNKFSVLKNQLSSFEDEYDFIFFDAPPSPDTAYLRISMGASDFFIVLTTIESDAFRNIESFYEWSVMVKEYYNPNLDYLGIIINLRDKDDDTFEKLDKEYKFKNDDFFKTIVPRRTRLFKYKEYGLYNFTNNALAKLDIHDKKNVKILNELTDEILKRIKDSYSEEEIETKGDVTV